MTIKSLIMHNFGVYAGTNSFNFNSDKPVILIGGMNGRGKTTLLEAVLLVLYGRRSFAFSESNLPYEAYLRKLINVADETLDAYIEIEINLGSRKDQGILKIRRIWNGKAKIVNDKVSVEKNGTTDIFLSDNWAMYMEELLPSAISRFFFFDGEKISELAASRTNDQIKNSIKTLLGIDVLDRVENDLYKILSAKQKQIAKDFNQPEIQTRREELARISTEINQVEQEIATLSMLITTNTAKLEEFEGEFLVSGGNLGASKANLISRKESLEYELCSVNEIIMEKMSSNSPLILVKELLSSALAASQNEREQKLIRFTALRIETLLTQFLENNKADIKSINRLKDFIRADMAREQSEESIYNLSENGYIQLQILVSSVIEQDRRELLQHRNRRQTIMADIEEIENYLMVDVDESTTTFLYGKIKDLTAEIAGDREKRAAFILQQSELISNRDSHKKELDRLIARSVSEMEIADDIDRIIQYGSKATEVICAYRLRLQQQKATHLANVVSDCYRAIAHKKRLICYVTIDEQTLDFTYWNDHDEVVPKNTTSAGEKQLMVTAMLWALAKCSNNRLPVIVDTPLARLDSAHRKLMIKNYFPYASEQTIILSTDSEIDKQYYDILKPFIGKEYTLLYNDETKSSTIQKGFFGGDQV